MTRSWLWLRFFTLCDILTHKTQFSVLRRVGGEGKDNCKWRSFPFYCRAHRPASRPRRRVSRSWKSHPDRAIQPIPQGPRAQGRPDHERQGNGLMDTASASNSGAQGIEEITEGCFYCCLGNFGKEGFGFRIEIQYFRGSASTHVHLRLKMEVLTVGKSLA